MVCIITVGGDMERSRVAVAQASIPATSVLAILDESTQERSDVTVTIKGNGNALVILQSSEGGAAFADVVDPISLVAVNASQRAIMRIHGEQLKLQWNNPTAGAKNSADTQVEGLRVPVA